MTYRCCVNGSGERWQRIYADLDIATSGRSHRQIKALLEARIKMDLESVVELPEEEQLPLLVRRAAWRVSV